MLMNKYVYVVMNGTREYDLTIDGVFDSLETIKKFYKFKIKRTSKDFYEGEEDGNYFIIEKFNIVCQDKEVKK